MQKAKYLLFLLILVFITFGNDLLAESDTFSDVKEGHWCKDNIQKFASLKLINGYPDGTFRPNDAISAHEFLTLIYRIFRRNWAINMFYFRGDQDFTLDKEHSQEAIESALEIGIIRNGEIDNYAQPISRAEMARILSRTISIMDYPTSFIEEIPDFHYDYTAYSQCISDFGEMSEYQDYILAVFAKGIVNGYPDGEFKHSLALSRAEAVAVLTGLTNKEARINLEIQKYINAYPMKRCMLWEDGVTDFIVEYRGKGTYLPIEKSLAISREDGLKYSEKDFYENRILEQISVKLTEEELREVFEYIVNDNYFFVIPSSLGIDDLCYDGSYSRVGISLDGKVHIIGGYMVENEYFSNIVNKLFELKRKHDTSLSEEPVPSAFERISLQTSNTYY